jgi:hypothetical protein
MWKALENEPSHATSLQYFELAQRLSDHQDDGRTAIEALDAASHAISCGLAKLKDEKRVVVKLTQDGALQRVLEGKAGMTFIVDKFTNDRYGNPTVAHVRDYRFTNGNALYQIWSLGLGDYVVLDNAE